MPNLTYEKHDRISLKNNPEFNEKWVQDRIAEDPTIIGLGETVLLDRERSQERAGRLDILLTTPEEDRRYEVELMLGATDESHIIRCIEYWDIERRRYPGYEHCAVLIAEDITSRFLNVIGLLAGTVPLVVIQLNALKVGDRILLHFVRVIDQRMLRLEDTPSIKVEPRDRDWWIDRSSQSIIQLADAILEIINGKAQTQHELNYNKHYIGLSDGTRSRTFIHFAPRKRYLRVVIRDGWTEERSARFEEADIAAEEKGGKLIFNLSPADFKKHGELVTAVIHEVVQQQNA
ncbi:MAG: hypothetical protein OXI33_14940 [Chloroflexota bacterium]|nr:hypothetical protein [Chloroflexota bacterium]